MAAINTSESLRGRRSGRVNMLKWLPCVDFDYNSPSRVKNDFDATKPDDAVKPKSNRFKNFFSDLKLKFTRSSKESASLDQAENFGDGGQAKDQGKVATIKADKASECSISVLRPVDPHKYQDLADMLALRLSKRMWETAMNELSCEKSDFDLVKSFPPKRMDNDVEKSDFNKTIDELAVDTVVDMIIDIEEQFWTETV